MQLFKPRSILQLTVVGFLTVTGLLLVALIVTARELDGLSDQSQLIISRSSTAMSISRTLIEQTSSMERNARQYSIVGDEEILELYGDRRQRFVDAVEDLGAMALHQDMLELLNTLVKNETLAYQELTRGAEGADPAYPRLLETAYQVSDVIDEWTNTQLAAIRQETVETQQLLTVQALFLVSSALVLAGIFTALITRPLLQIERAINQLGSGVYQRSIKITGPRDLTSLGDRLDWLRDRLRKLERQRSSFLRHVSHELKTPLASMQESTSLLNEGVVGELNADQKEILEIQGNNCRRLQRLIDDLLRHNAESFSVLNAMPKPVRLDKLVEEVVSAHELIVKSGRLTIERKLNKVTINGDREQLRVVIDNLMTNAIKYSPEEGTITVTLQQNGSRAVLDIQDEGPGISREEAEKIFEAFYQGSAAGHEQMKGSGLGLAITQEYVNANGGSIEVIPEDRGAHFQVRFPLSRQDNA